MNDRFEIDACLLHFKFKLHILKHRRLCDDLIYKKVDRILKADDYYDGIAIIHFAYMLILLSIIMKITKIPIQYRYVETWSNNNN